MLGLRFGLWPLFFVASVSPVASAAVSDAASGSARLAATVCGHLTSAYDVMADRTALAEALRDDRFADLERMMDEMGRARSGERCSDRPMGMAMNAFTDADPELQRHYDSWVDARPGSNWALLARGKYFANRGYIARGAAYAANTSDDRFKAMQSWFDRAIADLGAVLKSDPHNSLAASQLMGIARYIAPTDEAARLFARLRTDNPDSYFLFVTRMTSLEPKWGGSIEEVRSFSEEAEKLSGRNPDFAMFPSLAACTEAAALRNEKRADEADKLMRTAAQLYAGRLEPSCFGPRMEVKAGSKTFEDSKPANAVPAVLTTDKDGRPHRATVGERLASLDQALVVEHGSPSLYCERANLTIENLKAADARPYVEKGLALDVDEPECIVAESRLRRLGPGGHGSAPEHVEAAVRAYPDRPRMQLEYGQVLKESSRFDEAEAALTKAIELAPDYAEARFQRGVVRKKLERYDEAVADFDAAIELAPKISRYYAWRGFVRLYDQQRAADAVKDYEQAVQLAPNDTQSWNHLALGYFQAKDCRARATWRKVEELCAAKACSKEITDTVEGFKDSDQMPAECAGSK